MSFLGKGFTKLLGIGLTVAGLATGNVQLAILGASLFASAALAPDRPGQPTIARGARGRSTVREAAAPAQYVVGRARVGGSLVFQAAQSPWQDDAARFQQVICLSEGPIEAIEAVYLNGEKVDFRYAFVDARGMQRPFPDAEQADPARTDQIVPVAGSKYASGGWAMTLYPAGRRLGEGRPPAFTVDLGFDGTQLGIGKAYVAIQCVQRRYRKASERIWKQPPQWSFVVRGIKVPVPTVLDPADVLPVGDYVGPVGHGRFVFAWDRTSRRVLQYEPRAGIARWLSNESDLPASATPLRFLTREPAGAQQLVGFTGAAASQAALLLDRTTGLAATALAGWSSTFIPSPQTRLSGAAVQGVTLYLLDAGAGVLWRSAGRGAPFLRVAAVAGAGAFRGLAALGGRLWTIDPTTRSLHTIDPVTGAVARVGAAGALGAGAWEGPAESGGLLYAIEATARRIHRIDPATGETTAAACGWLLSPVWSHLAHDVQYWYLRDILGWPGDVVDMAAWVASRVQDAEDVTVVLPADPSYRDFPRTYTRHTADGVIRVNDDRALVLRELGFCAGLTFGMYELGGVYYFLSAPPGVDRAIEFTIRPEDVARYGDLRTAGALQDKANAVSMALDQSAEHDWTTYRLPLIIDAASEAQDRARYEKDLGTRSLVSEPIRALMLGVIYLRRLRAQRSWSMTLLPGAGRRNVGPVADGSTPLVPYQRGMLALPDYGIDAEPVEVFEVRLNGDDTMDVIFIESPDGVYADDARFPEVLPAPAVPPAQPTPDPVTVEYLNELLNHKLGDIEENRDSVVTNTGLIDTLGSELLAPPANVRATDIQHDSLTFSWDAIAGTQSYAGRLRRDGAAEWGGVIVTSQTRLAYAGLLNATAYDFEVRRTAALAGGSLATSAWSDATATTLAAARPNAPTGLRATNLDSTTLTLSWSAVANATGYEWQRRTGAGAWSASTAASAASVRVTGLAASTQYGFRVRALTSGVAGAWSAELMATTFAPAPNPARPTAAHATSGNVGWTFLSWTSDLACQVRWAYAGRITRQNPWRTLSGLHTNSARVEIPTRAFSQNRQEVTVQLNVRASQFDSERQRTYYSGWAATTAQITVYT